MAYQSSTSGAALLCIYCCCFFEGELSSWGTVADARLGLGLGLA